MTPVLIPGTFICDSFFLAELWEKLYLVQRGRDLHIFRLSNRNLPRVNKPTYKPKHQPWLCHPRNLFIRFLCIIWIFFCLTTSCFAASLNHFQGHVVIEVSGAHRSNSWGSFQHCMSSSLRTLYHEVVPTKLVLLASSCYSSDSVEAAAAVLFNYILK